MKRLLLTHIHRDINPPPRGRDNSMGVHLRLLMLLFMLGSFSGLMAQTITITSVSNPICNAAANGTLTINYSTTLPGSFNVADAASPLSVEFFRSGVSETTSSTTANFNILGGSLVVNIPTSFESGTDYTVEVTTAVSNITSNTSSTFTINGLELSGLLRGWPDGGVPADADFCPGERLRASYNLVGGADEGNEFILELSDPSGNFNGNEVIIGRFKSDEADGGLLFGTIPLDAVPSNDYNVRLRITNPDLIACAGFTPFPIDIVGAPSFSAQPELNYEACTDDNISINTTVSGADMLQWEKLCLTSGNFFETLRDTSALPSDIVNAVAVNGANIYVGTFGGLAVYDGAIWTTWPTVGSNVLSLFVDLTNDRVYAGTDDGLTIFSSAGTVLANVGTPTLAGSIINDVVANDNDVYVATNGGLTHLELTGGGTVSSSEDIIDGPTVNAVAVDNFNTPNNQIIYAATTTGLQISLDNTLRPDFCPPIPVTDDLSPPAGSNVVRDVFVTPQSGFIFVGTQAGMAYSTNGGVNWTRVSNGLSNDDINSITVVGNLVFAGTPDGLAVSTLYSDAFTQYTPQDGIGFGAASAVNDVSVVEDPAGTYTVNAATFGGLSQGTLMLMDVSNGSGISGATTDDLSIDPVEYADALCRYRLRATSTGGCVTYGNFAKVGDIPPTPVASVITPASGCESGFGSVEINGLVPGVEYQLNISKVGGFGMLPPIPNNGDNFTAGSLDSSVTINLLDTGRYTITVTSLVAPMCESLPLEVTITGPALPTIGGTNPLPVAGCGGDQVIINLPALPTGQIYQWFSDATLSTQIGTSTGPFEPSPRPTVDTDYWVVIRDNNTSCTSSDTLLVNFTVEDPVTLAVSKTTRPATITSNDGVITLSGLMAGDTYEVHYFAPNNPNEVVLNGQVATGGEIVLSGLLGGQYNNIYVVSNDGAGCESNRISCPLIPLDVPDETDNFLDGPAFTLDTICGGDQIGTSGFFQKAEPEVACTGTNTHWDSQVGPLGIVVGRVRNPEAIIPLDPTEPVEYTESDVEFKGYVIFDLFAELPPTAYIDKIEYAAAAHDTYGQMLCDVPLESATGDIQFDVTRLDSFNYGPYPFGFDEDAYNDIANQKYADFTIAGEQQGAWTDLGPQAVRDMQARLALDGQFQIGLTLSGGDFDVPVYRFHGIVFKPGDEHKLRITYHLRDYGDLSEAKYTTDLAGGLVGPYHRSDSVDVNPAVGAVTLMPTMYIGGTPPDAERDAMDDNDMAMGDDMDDRDDEDLAITNFFNSATGNELIAGDTIRLTFDVTNNLPTVPANLIVFIDWNDDGVFQNDTERYAQQVAANVTDEEHNFNITIPATAANDTIGVRVRLTSGDVFDAYGEAPNGEVEDFLVRVYSYDYADLPDAGAGTAQGDYETTWVLDGSEGPRHLLTDGLRIGNLIDAEANGQPQVNAVGDDIGGLDDEDGIIAPDTIIRDIPARFSVFIVNETGEDAYLFGYVDWNDDGAFDGPNETSGEVLVPSGMSGYVDVTFTVPPMPVPLPDRVGTRFRLSNENVLAALPTGPSLADGPILGEVQDLFVDIAGYDWGDLQEPRYITDREGGVPGPSHKIVSIDDAGTFSLFIGATPPDAENEGIPTEKADGDDEVVNAADPEDNRVDDEDLSAVNFVTPGGTTQDTLTAGEPIDLLIPVTNNSGSTAYLWAFVDWNGDGDFDDDKEELVQEVASNVGVEQDIRFEYAPIPARPDADSIGVRIRFTTANSIDAYGPAPDGEVEDFLVELKAADFGDLPDPTAGVDQNDFRTLRMSNGARHSVPVTPLVFFGSAIDTERNGLPTMDSDGDDLNRQLDDEDGVIFLTPLIPGKEASVAFKTTNNSPRPATIFMYADWENDGVMVPVTLSFNSVAASSGFVQGQVATFDVPATATYEQGRAYFRFRITTDTDFIAADSDLGLARDGEVEDYFVPIFQLGNLVWEDRNNNGRQDAEEIPLGIDDVRVVMRFGGIDATSGAFDAVNQNTILNPNNPAIDADFVADFICDTLTADNGLYNFFGLIEGNYQVIAVDSFDLTPTRVDWLDNVTEEDLDSDGKGLKLPWEYVVGDIRQSKSQVFELNRDSVGTDEEGILDQLNPELQDPNQLTAFPDNRFEQRVDFGYTGFDMGDLDSTYITVEDGIDIGTTTAGLFPTDTVLIGNALEGPKHIVDPVVYLGSCSDAEVIGHPDYDAGAEFAVAMDDPLFPDPYNGEAIMDGKGDDPFDSGWNTTDGNDTLTCDDDENGVMFMTPLIPGYPAIIDVDFYTTINYDGPDAFLQAYIDWNGDGDFYVDGDPAMGIDPNEHIIFTHLNGDTLLLEKNTLAVELEMYTREVYRPIRLQFDVPSDAKMNDGNVHARFRIGKSPNLGPTGILPGNENFPDGIVPEGEVEDYFMKLSKVGNLVWEDRDYDGIQDIDEPVIAGVKITLDYHGIDTFPNGDFYEMQYETVTDENGKYYFCGLIGNVDPSGIMKPTYALTADDPEDMTPTANRDTFPFRELNNGVVYNSDGNDDNIDDLTTTVEFAILNPMDLCVGEAHPNGINDMTDSLMMDMDGDPLVRSIEDNIWPDCQMDETLDFGYVGMDYGDLPDTTLTDADEYQYWTRRDWLPGSTPNDFGARHAIQPRLFLGDGVDGELDGQPDILAGSKGDNGDDADTSAFRQGTGVDDENGIRLMTPLLPGEFAYIQVRYTSQDTLLAGGYEDTTAYLNAFIDWNGDGEYYLDVANPAGGTDAEEAILFTHQGSTPTSLTALGTATTNPALPGGVDQVQYLGFRVPDTMTADFFDGRAFMRFRLSFEGLLDPDNFRYHQEAPPHVVYSPNPGGPVKGPALDWDWDDPLQRYPRGEVEDYAVPLAKVGNLSWYDHNVNGRQDMTTEALYNTYRDSFGVDTLHLVLIWGGLEVDGTFDAVGFQDTDMDTDGTVSDILYNWSIVPQIDGTFTDYMTPNYDPTDTLKTTPDGLFSFRGLIPGNYYLIPLKYLQADSTDFVNFWPKHRVLTVKNNQTMTDSLDSDAGPGAEFTINDINPNDPEVCVGDLPTGEDGQLDMPDNMMDPYFPDTLYDQTIDLGWVDEPNIEASLDLVGVDFPESEECGNFNVIFHLCLKNPQETPLDSIVPFLNIRAGYGDAFVAGSAQVSIVEKAFTTNPTVECEKDQIAMNGSVDALTPFIDPAYTGEGADTFLLTGGDSETRFYLPGDSVVCIRIEFEINPAFYNPTVANNFCPWMIRGGSWARAVGFSYDPNESTPWTGGDTKVPLIDWSTKDYQGNPNDRFGRPIEVYDLSDELDDPWPGPGAYKEYGDSIRFEGFVMDRGDFGEYKIFVDKSLTGRDKYLDEDDYTIQNDSCWVKTQRLSGVDNIFITLDENCEVKLDPSTFITNHMEECGFDRYPEGSYYRVVIQDEHTGETLWASADRVPFDGAKYRDRKLIYKARSVANHCEVIWGRITLEDKTPPIVTCPPTVDESAIGRPLVCADIEDILNNPRTWTDPDYVYYTGMATADDNCDGSEAIFDGANDVLEVLSDCDESAAAGYVYARIVRTFKFRDASGNEGTCSQEILFRRPQIILPECEVYLDICEVGDDEELTPADLIAKYERLMSVPYYIDGAGENVYLTEDEACGFGIFWENSAVFEKDNCGYKIERTWSIRDWCYGVGTDYPDYLTQPLEDAACYDGVAWTLDGAYSWKQLLVVGDTVAPFVTIPDLDEDGFKGVNGYKDGPTADPTVSTESFDAEDVYEFSTGNECSASFSVTKDMFEISGECRDWCFDLDLAIRRPVLDLDERPIPGEFEFVPVDEANITGDCDGGYWVFDVPMDLDPTHYYFFKMRVFDECNNDTLIYAPFRVIDDTKPVVICDDNIRVTFDNFGTGSLAAVDVDEGTSDNCDKILWLKVRRPVGDCTDGFRGMLSYVDANNNSIIDEADYIDENNNNAPDELEYFQIDEDGVLMSPLLDKIPFFCCDPDSVKVELWASDKFGNRSNCWQYALLENRPDISLELPGNFILPESQVYDCTEEEDNVVLLANSSGIYAQGSLTYNAAVALLGGDLFILQDNTCGGFTREMEVTSEFDQCGFGQIKVRWILTAGSELPPPHTPESLTTDYRTIDIIEKHDYWIKFPKDTYVNCATPNPDTIEVSSEACDLIAVATLPDERFETPQDPNSCYKIFRTYRVINWCEYDGQDIPVIVSRDWDAHNGTDCTAPINGDDDVSDAGEYNMNPQKPDGDGTPGNSDIYVIVDSRGSDAGNNREGIVYYDNDADPFNNSTDDPDTDLVEGYWWAVSVDDNCAPSTWYDDEDNPGGDLDGSDAQDDDDNRYGSHGFWQYTQHIIVYDDVDPELTVALADTFYSINNTDCAADISFTVDALDLCNGDTTNLLERVVINNEDVTFNLVDGTFTGRYGEGKHTVIVTARDACGNVATFTGEFEVVDGKAPAPIIREDMVVELGRSDVDTTGGGSATIWANDFEASPIYDCNGQDGSDTDAFGNPRVTKYSINRVGEPVDENQTGLSFTCADAGTRIEVEIHAWDELGNHDFARTFVEVQDNIGACDVEAGAGSIAGLVATPENRPVNEVEVRLSGEAQRNFMTNATGTYAFTELAEDSDYTVIPSKDDFDENGLSTFDVILMQKHIVGSDLLDSPYKLIAADINRSGDITTLDLIQLRKMVLGVDTKFSSNTSWRFVDADYIFPTDVFSQPFPEVKNINNLEGDEEVNFIAIKIGDLNGSADAYVQPRSNESLGLIAKAETRMLEAGVDYRIDFSSEELVGVQGYQFSLELGDVELIETIYGQAKADHFGIFRKEGLITTSWNGQGAEGNLFSLVIRPSTDIALSDAVRIGSRKTEAEAYNAQGEIMDINLEFEVDGAQVIGNALFQNTPNPFQGETQIRFFLGEAQRASLKIRDVTGKLVKVIEGDFAQGRHEVRLRANELPSAGVYFYTLEAGDYLATRKLIVLDEVTR